MVWENKRIFVRQRENGLKCKVLYSIYSIFISSLP